MIQTWLSRIVLGLLAAAVGFGVYVAVRTGPVLVDTARVAREPMEVTIDAEGVARVRDVYTVSSPIAGRLARVQLDEGDPVKAYETVIASIHPLDPPFLDERARSEAAAIVEAARSAVKLARAEHDSAGTALSLAMSEYDRVRQLAGQDLVSRRALEQAASEVKLKQALVASAQANIRLRHAELASAEARLAQPGSLNRRQAAQDCCLPLTAPVDGVVLRIATRSEQAVAPGAEIAEIGDPQNIEIVIDLLSQDAPRLTPGGKAEIAGWGGDATFSATIRRIDPSAFTKVSALGIEEQRVNAVLDPDTLPPGLGHGYRVYARLVVWSTDSTLTVPIGALFRAGGDWAVFAVEDGRARKRRIEVGRINASRAQVTGGISEDSTVILYPGDTLSDGSPVELRDAD